MSLRKEFKELEREFESFSAAEIQMMREDSKRFNLEGWIAKYPRLKKLFLLALRVLALLPFTGPVTDVFLNGAIEILERENL